MTNNYRTKQKKFYAIKYARKHRTPSFSQKKDDTQLRLSGLLKRNVKPGELFCQELLRAKDGIDPRTFEPTEHGVIPVRIKGNPRAKVFMRRHNLQIIDTSCKE